MFCNITVTKDKQKLEAACPVQSVKGHFCNFGCYSALSIIKLNPHPPKWKHKNYRRTKETSFKRKHGATVPGWTRALQTTLCEVKYTLIHYMLTHSKCPTLWFFMRENRQGNNGSVQVTAYIYLCLTLA